MMKKLFFSSTALMLIMLQANAQLKPISYSDGDQKLNGISVKAEKVSKTKPGVLILPAWKGIDNQAKTVAEQLAKLDYTVFIADIYGEGNYPKNNEEAGLQARSYSKNVTDYHRRIALALAELVKSGANPDNIIVIGYCFGGAGALEAARMGLNVKGVVAFHGSLGKNPNRVVNQINAKVLVLHGADDPYISNPEIAAFHKEMRDAKADWEMIYYSNAVHAFTNPEYGTDNSQGAAYNEKADKRSWERMKMFMKEVFL